MLNPVQAKFDHSEIQSNTHNVPFFSIALMNGVQPTSSPLKCEVTYTHEETRQMLHCSICNLDLKGKIQFEAHTKSKRHRGMVNKLKRTTQLLDLHTKKLKSISHEDNVE